MTGIADRWAAYQFDQAVTFFGTNIEAAAQEQQNVGDKDHPDWQPRYTMAQLLAPGFRLPAPVKPADEQPAGNGLAVLKGLPGVKVTRA